MRAARSVLGQRWSMCCVPVRLLCLLPRGGGGQFRVLPLGEADRSAVLSARLVAEGFRHTGRGCDTEGVPGGIQHDASAIILGPLELG